MEIPVHLGRVRKVAGLEFCWWGPSQWYKWRWHRTHIDLGILSIYGIERPWLWMPLAWAIKPMRVWYHWRYCYSKRGQQRAWVFRNRLEVAVRRGNPLVLSPEDD